ncbi:hypothetical protein RIF29_40977 [Crotalaria pallida]|uniref:Pectinesterase inhibitor domain-containing protein n=1 Tax=Crotalaria pallida TaxID=3830 RepID=A0AAN9E439_CROPI
MEFTKNLVLIVSISSLLFLHSATALIIPLLQNRVKKLCNGVTDPALCVKSILPNVRLDRKGNVNSYRAVEVEIIAAKTQAVKTANLINTLLASPASNKQLKESLSICKEQYGMMLDAINEAIPIIKKRDHVEARFKFSAVFSYKGSCEQAFETGPPQPASLIKEQAALKNLAGNVLDILKVIDDKDFAMRLKKGLIPNFSTVSSPPNKCQNVIGSCTL